MLPAACPRSKRRDQDGAEPSAVPGSAHTPGPHPESCRTPSNLPAQAMEGSGAGPRTAPAGDAGEAN
eukprot:15806100-Heterocapsa_arctica.AAC.1